MLTTGETRTIRLHGAIVPAAHAHPPIGVVMFHDVTQLKRVEEDLRRSDLIKDDFLRTMSHELRTPLNAIVGWLDLLRQGCVASGEMSNVIDILTRSASTLNRLVGEILDVSRIISGKLTIDARPVELAKIVQAALDSVRPAAIAKKIVLPTSVNNGGSVVRGDEDRLLQIFWNLLTNALKFTPEGGTIGLRIERGEGLARVVVSDNGVGIEPKFLPHVFDRFRQADSSTTRKYGGLGLGLSIVRELVELHGGIVRAESAGPGQGATLTVELPVTAARNGGVAADRAPSLTVVNSDGPLVGQRVLVIDDESDSLQIARRNLGRAGAEVHIASSVRQALELVRAMRPNLIFCDIAMPERDGFEFLVDLRSLGNDSDRIPVIAWSAHTSTVDRARAAAAGFNGYLTKPTSSADLIAEAGLHLAVT